MLLSKVIKQNTKFYTFRQNNSGGSFDIDEKLSEWVIIEAINGNDAISKAENIGIYFNVKMV